MGKEKMASLSKVVTRSLLCSSKSLPIAAPNCIGIKLKSTCTELNLARIPSAKFHSAVPNRGGTINEGHDMPVAKYGGRHTVSMMPGEGIGPEMIIDNCCMQLVSTPSQFDVMVLTNLQG